MTKQIVMQAIRLTFGLEEIISFFERKKSDLVEQNYAGIESYLSQVRNLHEEYESLEKQSRRYPLPNSIFEKIADNYEMDETIFMRMCMLTELGDSRDGIDAYFLHSGPNDLLKIYQERVRLTRQLIELNCNNLEANLIFAKGIIEKTAQQIAALNEMYVTQ